MEIEIRAARPEDAKAAVPCVYSSGPAAFDYVFSHRTPIDAQAFLRRAFQQRPGEFGHGCHVVATLPDGAVVGTGASFSGEDSLSFTLAAARQIFSAYGPIAGAGVVRRGLQVERVVKPPSEDLHYIAHIGVAAEWRGQGIGERIVRYLLDSGRKLGRRLAALDVSVENPRAEALYRRIGFEVTDEIASPYENETARVVDHRRMEIAL